MAVPELLDVAAIVINDLSALVMRGVSTRNYSLANDASALLARSVFRERTYHDLCDRRFIQVLNAEPTFYRPYLIDAIECMLCFIEQNRYRRNHHSRLFVQGSE